MVRFCWPTGFSKLSVSFVIQLIGAVNTIIRRPVDGKLIGYNTDCEASMSAIEDALRGIILHKTPRDLLSTNYET